MTALGLFGAGLTAPLAQAVAPARNPVSAVPERVRAGGSPLLQETFTNATADPRFVAVGDACLTGAPAATPGPGDHPLGGCPLNEIGPVPPLDSAPFGYLRLTESGNDESGAVLFDQALPAGNGLDVTFDQWQYGSTTPNTPADGISFFLVNGDVSLTHPGAFGGSLGYAQKLPNDDPNLAFLPGVDRGYLGVGLDVLGNYFGDWEHRGNGCATRSPAGTIFRVPAPGANMVTVRGPGDGTDGYCFLTATTSNFTTSGPWPSTLPGKLQGPLTTLPPGVTPEQAQTLLEPSRRRVEVHLSPAPSPVLTVNVDFNDGTGPHQVLQTPAPQPVPATYKFGFAGSTGSFTDVHLIRNVSLSTDAPLPALNLVKQPHEPLPGLLTVGTPVPYDFVVTNSGTVPINNLAVEDPKVGPVSCPVSTLAPGETVTCTATYLITAADAAAGNVTNTAQATGTADGNPITSPPSTVTLPVVSPPGLTIVKHVDAPEPFAVGDTIPYSYVVTNTGGTTIDALTVTDDKATGITCAATVLAPAGSPGDSTICKGTYVVTAADAQAEKVTNHAQAHGTSNGQPVDSPPTEATVTVIGPASIGLTKQASTPGPVHVGDTVNYTYTVTNTGTATLTDVAVNDDHVTPITCDNTTLTAGQVATCHGSYVVTTADLDLGHVTNTALATATGPQGQTVESPPAEVTLQVIGVGKLELTKQADTLGPVHVGDTVNYTYTVTNTGTAPLTNIAVTDDHVASVTCAQTSLNPGQSTTCHGSYVVTGADLQAGHVTNTAHATGTDPQGQTVQSPPAEVTLPVAGVGLLELIKRVDTPGPVHVGDTVNYTYTVTNTGTAALTNITVTDDHVSPVTCTQTSLTPGQSTTCHGSYVVTGADLQAGHVTNTAHATGTDPQGQTIQSSPEQATITVIGVGKLELTKQADTLGPVHVGDTVNYTYTVTNTGTAPLTNVAVADDLTPVTCGQTTLNPGQSTTCHGSYVVTPADLQAGHVTNIAVATATGPQGETVESPPAEVTLEVIGVGLLELIKRVDTPGPVHVGDTVNYTYTVTNTGTATLTNITVTDDHVTSVTCAQTSLNPGQSTTCHGSYVVTTTDLQAGHVTNTARASGTNPQGQSIQSSPEQATITVIGVGALELTKQPDTTGPFHVGDTVTYTYAVTNTGTATLTNIAVTDDHVTSVTCGQTTLDPGQSTRCDGSYVVTAADLQAGHVTNTAHATGTTHQGETVQSPPAQATVTVIGVGRLQVTKQPDTPGPFQVGDTVNYTYTVTNTGTATLTNIAVTDDHVTSVTCAPTTLNPGQSSTCHGSYVITAADGQAGHVTNTAHATGTDPQGQTVQSPPAQATVNVGTNVPSLALTKRADATGAVHPGETITYTYTVTNTGNTTLTSVTVNDDRVQPVTCDRTTLEPGQSTTCHGTYVVTEADAEAGSITNTARATARDPQGELVESPPVEVCVAVSPCPPKDHWNRGGGRGCPNHPGHPGGYPIPPQADVQDLLAEVGSPSLAAGGAGSGLIALSGLVLRQVRRRAATARNQTEES
ncbi:DUF11 domain-containing protein [Streptomyces sp. FH025]|uniref:DUF7507 domain-containing protein n=1 Tax=Streptomyces sp. FH025 TaxID=2815937 RepID=UPI001A9FC473|nr:DUF11 domain-containing protein [Streptomyces sp. FH025]MBO1415887.1 DUF11 domain-containing protein [Streptomyces sp. FH025]